MGNIYNIYVIYSNFDLGRGIFLIERTLKTIFVKFRRILFFKTFLFDFLFGENFEDVMIFIQLLWCQIKYFKIVIIDIGLIIKIFKIITSSKIKVVTSKKCFEDVTFHKIF